MLPLILGMAAAGLLKSQLVDKPREDRQRRLASETQRYSPWTHMQAQPIQEADPFGSALGFGSQGASLGMQMDSADAARGMQEKMGANMDAQTDLYKRSGFNFGQTADPMGVGSGGMQMNPSYQDPEASPWFGMTGYR